MPRRKEPELTNPPVWRVVTGALLLLLIGSGFGFYRLAQEPVVVAKDRGELEEIEPGTAYYVRGSDAGGENWTEKRSILARSEAAAMDLTPGDLNRWSDRYLRAVSTAEGEGKVLGVLDLSFQASQPNFSVLENGQLQIAVPLEFPGLAPERTYYYVARGRFYRDGNSDDIYFGVEQSQLNAAPLALTGPLQQSIFKGVLKPFVASPEGQEVAGFWPQFNGVEIDGPAEKLKFLLAR
ncbi:MAG: hypothetical protein Q7P63_09185 [Verrucomicrobiota bacterium JB022]|nr:hypothetical protein [Verrucomicrobiota bacterium JB022]